MKQKVYVETSFVSYLTSRPSRDLIVAAQKQVTHEWWQQRRSHFDLYISQLVLQESAEGEKEAASERLRVIQNFQVLELRTEALELAESFISQNALPQKASDDALHIALATIYGIDYLLTWNCKHMANAEIQKKIAKIGLEQGYEIPTICTPYELMGE